MMQESNEESKDLVTHETDPEHRNPTQNQLGSDSNLIPEAKVEVRGISVMNTPAEPKVKALAYLTDAGLAIGLLAYTVKALHFSPMLRAWGLLAVACAGAVLWLLQQSFFGITYGQNAWGLRLLDHKLRPVRLPGMRFQEGRLFQKQRLDSSVIMLGSFLTALTTGFAIWFVYQTVWLSPLIMKAEPWELTAFVPGTTDSSITATPAAPDKDWIVVPFFYTVGAWPRHFEGKPVLFQLPYEKGPPSKFLGHIVARWDMPDIRLTFEGPRTPEHARTPEGLRDCFVNFGWNSKSCLRAREETLYKVLQEMKSFGASEYSLRWFEVANPALTAGERAHGIYISGTGPNHAQDRFILVNSQGTQQSLILDRTLTAQGDRARTLFEKSVRSQRLSDELYTGRAWIDRQLTAIRLQDLAAMTDLDQFIAKISEVQALLLAKISVEPKTYDAYFHLSGTALMLARKAAENKNVEWSAAVKPMIEACLKYARDVAPNDVRTKQLEAMAIDAKKF